MPLPAVVLALTNKDDGYIISFFPPLFCITRNMDVWFYSTMLVIDVLGVAHMSILVIIFCVVHKVGNHIHILSASKSTILVYSFVLCSLKSLSV